MKCKFSLLLFLCVLSLCCLLYTSAYCNGTFDEKKVAAWDERLRSVFNRGFWDGYYSVSYTHLII